MVFKGNTGVYERIYRFSSKWARKKRNNDDIFLRGRAWQCVWFLEARSENECEKWHFLVWNRVRIGRTGQQPQTKIPRITSGTLTRKLRWNLDITKGQGTNLRASSPGRSSSGTEKRAPELHEELDCEHPSDFEENKRLGRTSGERRSP